MGNSDENDVVANSVTKNWDLLGQKNFVAKADTINISSSVFSLKP